MDEKELQDLLKQLIALPSENEWVEFKESNANPQGIGERISALANSAALHNQSCGYLIYGIENETHKVVGTSYSPRTAKKGGEEVEHWLATRLNPRIDFRIYEFDYDGEKISIFEIPAAIDIPVTFLNIAYIRVGTITRKLRDFSAKERKIWEKRSESKFETQFAITGVDADEILSLLDYTEYFELMKLALPTNREAIIERLCSEKLVVNKGDKYNITNLGGLLFARDLNNFDNLARRAMRVIEYNGKNRISTKKDQTGAKGYAIGFKGMIDYINDRLPSNEVIEKALRKTERMYPELAIRELTANALIHQDFSERGTGPTVEIFDDRVEITNPGEPVITTMRFIDNYQSRNEKLASLMRRVGICEEQGSGIDKVIFNIELSQLPAPDFIVSDKHTKAILYASKALKKMTKKDKIRACYQHSCLKYVSNEQMTNQSLRERFGIEKRNHSTASRIIAETMEADLIKDYDPDNSSKRHAKYIPFWA